MNFKIITIGFLFSFISSFCYAENNQSKATIIQGSVNNFAGLKFGVGISLTHDIGSHKRVGRASVVNGIVRVNEEENDIARVMLESHYFFTPNQNFLVPAKQWGWGPFVSLQPGTNEIIEAIGAGIMFGFKRNNSTSSSSWNVGFGFVIDPNVTILGDGLSENRPIPKGETTVRLKETSQIGLLLLSSFSF